MISMVACSHSDFGMIQIPSLQTVLKLSIILNYIFWILNRLHIGTVICAKAVFT